MQGLVRFLQTNANSNILATPQIIALDNTEALFESKEKVPVQSSTIGQGGVVSVTPTKEDITLSIKIKPQINKLSNFVKLDIDTKLGDFSDRPPPAELAGKATGTIERNAKTSVVVADTDTVVIGGLVRDKMTETVAKIPVLGDIPLLGWLFKSSDSQVEKTNLLIFLTPTIIRQYEKVRAILDRKLKERDDFLEKSAGGEDPMRPYRDEMIRKLPDVSAINANKPVTTVSIDDDDGAPPAMNSGRVFSEPPAPATPQNLAPMNSALPNISPAGEIPPPPLPPPPVTN